VRFTVATLVAAAIVVAGTAAAASQVTRTGGILFGGPAYAPHRPFLGVQVFRASSTAGSCRRILAEAPEDAGGVQLTRDGQYAVIELGARRRRAT